jgi:hypothetical protein
MGVQILESGNAELLVRDIDEHMPMYVYGLS